MLRSSSPREMLAAAGIQPSAQRLAVAEFVLFTEAHPSADEVLAAALQRLPAVSRATVYNTLHLFVEKGLLQQLVIAEGRVVFDPNVEQHHHFLDEETGRIFDLPAGAVELGALKLPAGFDARDVQVIVRGRRSLGGSCPRRRGRAQS